MFLCVYKDYVIYISECDVNVFDCVYLSFYIRERGKIFEISIFYFFFYYFLEKFIF